MPTSSDKETNATPRERTELTRIVARRIRRADNMRLLRRLPAFAVEPEMPQRFQGLLDRLDAAEE